MAKQKVLTDVRDLILEKMKDEGRTLTWLSKKTEIPYGTLEACLKRKMFSLSQSNLDKINSALKADFTME